MVNMLQRCLSCVPTATVACPARGVLRMAVQASWLLGGCRRDASARQAAPPADILWVPAVAPRGEARAGVAWEGRGRTPSTRRGAARSPSVGARRPGRVGARICGGPGGVRAGRGLRLSQGGGGAVDWGG